MLVQKESPPTHIAVAAEISDSGNQAEVTIPGKIKKNTFATAANACPVKDKT